MDDDVLQFPYKKDLMGIIEEGVDHYISRIDNAVPGFLARINRHLLDATLQYIPTDLVKDLTQVSSGSQEAKHQPKNMLSSINGMRGTSLNEPAYYAALGFVFFRLQEHEGAYAMLKMAIVAKQVAVYNIQQNMDELYQEAEENSNMRLMLQEARMYADSYIASTCQIAHKFFEWKSA